MAVFSVVLSLGVLPCLAAGQAPLRPPIPRGLDLFLPVPKDNPLTDEAVALGRALFRDPILSRDRSLACSSCHDPERVFTDGRALSVGVSGRVGRRSVPTLVNRGYGRAFFWDGRTTTLEAQVLRPIEDPMEMDLSLADATWRLNEHQEYRDRFVELFGQPPGVEDLGRALASYVRTIVSGDAPIDRYLGGDTEALSSDARAGLELFRGKGNCTTCHTGPTFTDEQFHNTGVAWRDDAFQDLGRGLVTGNEEDNGAFKTPTLRNVAMTAPYMHDGSLAKFDDVIEFYAGGGRENPNLDRLIRPLNLTAPERVALKAFLESLTGPVSEGVLVVGSGWRGHEERPFED